MAFKLKGWSGFKFKNKGFIQPYNPDLIDRTAKAYKGFDPETEIVKGVGEKVIPGIFGGSKKNKANK
tara:strand:- start:297 stop:497 length:201 start_codon:yes stop_codon:yes gene_type:complete